MGIATERFEGYRRALAKHLLPVWMTTDKLVWFIVYHLFDIKCG
jgi:hypothetical protein